MSFRGFRPGPVLALCLLALFAPGCGRDGPHVVQVKGTVTRGGKAVPKLFLNFWPEKGRPSWGMTDQDGNYTLNYERNRDGAVVGKHKVWVELRGSNPKEDHALRTGALKLHPEVKAILDKYGRDNTPLKVTVKDEDPQILNLDLD